MPHTPGPWRVQKDGNFPYVEADQGKSWNNPTICHLYEDVTPDDSVTIGAWLRPFDNADANARLMAAAPDLLEALEELLHAPDPDEVEDFTPLYRAIAKAHAAIAKAKGEQQ